MKKLIAALCISVGLLMLLCMGAYASTSGSLTGEEYMSYIKGLTGMEYQPPYVTSQAGDETISTSSGSLMLTATDLFIPGKNGHDVVVKRRYISQDSDFNYISDIISDRKNASLYRINYQGYRYTTQPNGQGTEYFILFYNEQHMYLYGKDTIYANPQFTQTAKKISENSNGNIGYLYYDYKNENYQNVLSGLQNYTGENGITLYRDKTSNVQSFYERSGGFAPGYGDHHNTSYLGQGWELLYPTLYGNFRDGNGETYTVNPGNEKYTDSDGNEHPEVAPSLGANCDYVICMMGRHLLSFEPIDSTHLGTQEMCYRKISSYDGDEIYFKSDGNPFIHVDKFGNEIAYQFSGTGTDAKLIKIIDTYGKEVNFHWTGDQLTKITYEDVEIHYNQSEVNNTTDDPSGLLKVDNDYYFRVTRKAAGAAEGETTEYKSKYTYGMAKYGTFCKNSTMYNIVQINHPTGGVTQYDYDSATNLYWYYDGDYKLELHIDKYKVTERKDLESVSSQQAYNKKTYSYQEERELVSHPVVLYETSADKMAYVSDEDGTYLYGYLEDEHFAKLLKCGTYSKGTLYEYTGISRNKWYPRVSREEVREYDTAGSPNTGLTVTTNYSYSDLFRDPLEKTVEQNGQIVSKTEWSYGWPYLGYVIHSWQYNDLKEQNGGVYPEEGYNHLKKKTEWLRLPTDISEGDATITEYVYDMSSKKYKAPSEIKIYSSISPTTIEEHKKYEYNSAGEVTKLTQKADEIAPSGADDPIPVWDVTQYIYANGRDSAGVWSRTMTTRKTEEQNGQTVQTADIIDTYDAYGNQIKKSGYGVDETEYEYDFQNRVVKERHPGDNTQKTYAYEIGGVTGTRMTITDEAGAVMRVKYDSLGRYLATEIYPGGEALETERVSYDSKSRVAGKIVSKGSGSGDSFTVHTDYWPSGKIKKEEIKNQSSNVLQRVEYEYEESYPDTGGYEANSQRVTIRKLVNDKGTGSAADDQVSVMRRFENALGQLQKEEAEVTEGGELKTYYATYEYDMRGNVKNTVSPRDNADSSFSGKSLTYGYDYAGRQTSVTNADNKTSFTGYDPLGRKIYEKGFGSVQTNYSYDSFGNMKSKSMPLESKASDGLYYNDKMAVTNYTYDVNGDMVKEQVKNSGVDAEPWVGYPRSADTTTYRTTNMGYDARHRLDYVEVEEEDGSKTYTKYFYDAKGNIKKMVTGLTTASVTESNIPETAHVTEYHYDPYLNSVTEIIQPDGTKQYYEYNYWNLVEEQGYEKDGEVQGVIHNSYSELGRLERQTAQEDGKENEFEYNNIGQIVRAVDDSGVRTYEYDERGRVTKETNGSEVKEYSYDENDNRTSLTVKRGGVVVQQEEYEYNRLNQLTQVKDGSGSVLASYTYNADGKITSESKGGALTTEYVYNTGGQLKSKTNKKAVDGSVIGKYDYSYYFDGNILSENDKLYEYDKQGRLVKEGNAENVQEYTSYSYDRFGNRESMDNVTAITGNEKSTTYEYDKNNRLVEETRIGNLWTSEIAPEGAVSYTYYEYDSMGNLVSKRGAESDLDSGEDHVGLNVLKTSPNNTLVEMYDYDGFNRLSQVRKGGTTAQYTYNAEGIRTAKTVNGERTTFILDGANVIGEVNGQNQVTNYIRGASGLILSKDPSNVMRYYVTNGHGDVMGLTDTTGTVIKSYTYDAFGIEQNIDSNDTNPFRYCGEYFDSETQSIYLRARYYSPAIGRFTQQDPAMDGLNWYVYCSSNPVNSIDPIGLFDYNSRLSKSREYSEDVEVLQNELVWLGYLDMSNGGWGYFGNKTLDAVNAYKNSMGLGNNGENWGVVGLETWQSLGLQYRTQADIDAGVKMIMYGGRTQYKDISVALSTAVLNDRKTFQDNEGNLGWFKGMVGDSGEWNIKRSPDAWENKVKTTFPGYSTKMYFNGNLVTVEDVGNITYGYLGTAAGIAPPILVGASSANHIKNHGVFGWGNEISDHDYIQMGIDWYNGVFA